MALISFSNVSKIFNNDLVLDHISFNIFKNEKVALIGNNGTGKTTIFKLILKKIEPSLLPKEDKPGDITILNNISIGYLSQDAISDITHSVREELEMPFEHLKTFEKEFNDLSYKLSLNPSDENLLKKYQIYLEESEHNRVYSYKNEIETMISKFSFDKDILDKKISLLSGGERMKIAFIKLLMNDYDVLLLDEPTNHLDISTIEWLENYLKNYKGTVFFISHDRYFIEALSSKIIELENKKVTTYNTTYENYLVEKENNFKVLLEQSKKEEEEIKRLKRFIEFYMPKPRFVGRAKDRQKKLEKIEENHIEAPKKVNSTIKMNIQGGNLEKKQLLEVRNLSIGYDNKLLVSDINFDLYGKDHLAVLGDNGIGKTTLIKTILKFLPILKGEIKEKRKLKYGYIKQNELLEGHNESALEYLRNFYPLKSDNELRNSLGGFLFRKDEVFKNINNLSNGERMRLSLCALALSSYDILILDEPTNHLDMVTKECLLESLKKYQGAIIFISHDRYFINQLSSNCLYLSSDKPLFIEGNYDDLKLIIDEKNNSIEEVKKIVNKVPLNLEKNNKNKLSNNKINELKSRMEEIEKELEDINSSLINDFNDYKKVQEIQEKKDKLEEEYFEILTTLD